MMLIDSSASGGRSLLPLVKALGVPCELTPLPAGDVCFIGNGPDGPLTVGIERKKVADVIACINDDRFDGVQLPKMVQHYDDRWFVVESEYRPSRDGRLLVPYKAKRKWSKPGNPRSDVYWADVWGGRGRRSRGWMYRDFILWQLTQVYMGHVHLFRTRDEEETARFVAALYRWWTGKLWHEHRSHLRLYSQPSDAARIRPSTFFRRVIKEFPNIYWTRSREAEKRFGTVERAVLASAEEWASLGNPKLGAKRGLQLYNLLRAKGATIEQARREADDEQGYGSDRGDTAIGRGGQPPSSRGSHAPHGGVIRGLVRAAAERRSGRDRRVGGDPGGESRGSAGRDDRRVRERGAGRAERSPTDDGRPVQGRKSSPAASGRGSGKAAGKGKARHRHQK